FGTQKFDKIGFIIDTARNGWGEKGDDRPRPGEGTKGLVGGDRVDTRTHRGHWCNVNDAGVGEVPKPAPDADRPHLDAFFWMKPPGEADGISFDIADYPIDGPAFNMLDQIEKDIVIQSNHPAYLGKTLDTMCMPNKQREMVTTNVVPAMSPHAGSWFHYQFIMLIENAYPALGESDYD
ncbi:MAG: glycoside hydrolase family 6 protein, partial [Saccharospirillaceae bacterium]|nr:glycoside hydrolase family 6 protein [Pseudomonadales bacterium]NRB80463.1 glycoside hydrolase family 6 protein [Saccharospirillaceae bacterium]